MRNIFLLLVLSSALALGLAPTAAAATLDVGTVDGNAPFSGQVGEGRFTETFNFTTPPGISAVTVSITNVSVFGVGGIGGFEADLDGNKADFSSANVGPATAQFLIAQGDVSLAHVLTIRGVAPEGGASFGGAIAVTANSPVPVPAAVWLFGSGLVGLARFRKAYGMAG